jgi:hemerythrin-like domain-containing protein
MTNTTNAAPTTSVTGMRLAHRMMLTDLERLTQVTRMIADGATPCPDRRAKALAAWLANLSTEIRHHHEVEDDTAWPVIEAAASGHVDLGVLTDDHKALDPMLDELATTIARFVAAPQAGARALADQVAELRDHLVEHITAEEASLFPVIERYVGAADWARVEKAAQTGGTGPAFTIPRVFAAIRPEERAELMAEAGAGQRLMLTAMSAVFGAGHRRRERLVFG